MYHAVLIKTDTSSETYSHEAEAPVKLKVATWQKIHEGACHTQYLPSSKTYMVDARAWYKPDPRLDPKRQPYNKYQ